MSSEIEDRPAQCLRIEPLLDDLLDGELTPNERTAVQRHLEGCAACTARFGALETLVSEARSLPRGVRPGVDLWPDIASRLSSRPRTMGGWPIWLRQAVAALLFMALGGALSQLLWPGWRDDATSGVVASDPDPTLRGRGIAAARAVDPRAEFALAEADYLRAKEALWAAVYHGHDAVSATTREIVEHNLLVIDTAILELRQALADDPGNPRLENLLLAQHRTEIDLLQRLTRATLEI